MPTSPILQNVAGDHFVSVITDLITDENVVASYALIAFTTLNGLLLLGHQQKGELHKFLKKGGKIDWIIGVDSITTADALRVLRDLVHAFPNQVRVRVFESQDNTLFHPKLYVFERRSGSGTVLVGSNNLTKGGLVDNTEIAVRLDLESKELPEWRAVFDTIAGIQGAVQEITDEILEKIAQRRRREVKIAKVAAPKAVVTEGEPERTLAGSRVLLQTVPKSGHRLSQVGIAAKEMGTFFRLIPGEKKSVRLQQVQPGKPPGIIEVRQLVRSPVNKNSRIEVGGLRGIAYPPGDKRPVVIFDEVSSSLYRYMLLMPRDDGYKRVNIYLKKLPTKGLALPHQITTVDELLGIWPGYPI